MGGRRRRDAGEALVHQTKDTNKNLNTQAHDCTYYTPAAVLCFGAPVTKRDRSPMAVRTQMWLIEAGGWEYGGHGQDVSCAVLSLLAAAATAAASFFWYIFLIVSLLKYKQ